MSQQNLDLSNIGSVIQQMGREAVTQHSDGHLFAHADCLTRLSANHLDPGCAYVRTWPPSGKEPLPRRADGLPIESQDMQKLRRQKGVPVLLSLSLLHSDDHASGIDVFDTQLDDFGGAQSRRVCGHEDRAVLEVGNELEKAPDLVEAQHLGESLRFLGIRNMLDRPVLLQRDPIEKSERANGGVEDTPGYTLDLGQMDLVTPNVFGAKHRRRFAKVKSVLGNAIDVVVLCSRGQVTNPHVFDHSLTQGSPLSRNFHKRLLSERLCFRQTHFASEGSLFVLGTCRRKKIRLEKETARPTPLPRSGLVQHRSVFICVHLWFRFWLRLCCAVEFVASFFRASVSLWPMMHAKF